jgi:hypothetical protein
MVAQHCRGLNSILADEMVSGRAEGRGHGCLEVCGLVLGSVRTGSSSCSQAHHNPAPLPTTNPTSLPTTTQPNQGLGKTLQAITFLAHLKWVMGVPGPHLVVVPLSVMSSWMTELQK